MIEELASYLAGLMLLVGSLFALIAVIGVLRLPDLFTRMHAASKAGTMGSGLLLLAIAVVAFDSAVILRAILGIGFLLLTAPVSAHLLARASYSAGYRLSELTTVNELDAAEKE